MAKKSKWKNRYWTETELWGMIDKEGNEVIPCKFDEINFFMHCGKGKDEDDSSYLMAHYGGWKTGKWGIIDFIGNWIVEPLFEGLGYDIYDDDLIIFYNADRGLSPDDLPEGIYSIKKKRVLFEPQFMDIDFYDDGSIKVEKYDEKLERNMVNIIDLSGKPKFELWYSSIWQRDNGNFYELSILDEFGNEKKSYIDNNGNNIFISLNSINIDDIFYSQNRILYKEDEKYGVMSFDGKKIILAKYSEIADFDNKYYIVKIGGKARYNDNGLYGLITYEGLVIIPIEYKNITMEKDILICENDEGTTLYRFEEKQS